MPALRCWTTGRMLWVECRSVQRAPAGIQRNQGGAWRARCVSCAPCGRSNENRLRRWIVCCVGCPSGTYHTSFPFETTCVKPMLLTSSLVSGSKLIAQIPNKDFGSCKVKLDAEVAKTAINEVQLPGLRRLIAAQQRRSLRIAKTETFPR